MFKTKYRIKKTITFSGYIVYDAQYKLWYWPFWIDINHSISRDDSEGAAYDIRKHQFKKTVNYENYYGNGKK